MQLCKFGAGCGRATCPYIPEVVRYLQRSTDNLDPGAAVKGSWSNRDPGEKNEAEKAVKEAEAAATAKKKDDSKPVAITI